MPNRLPERENPCNPPSLLDFLSKNKYQNIVNVTHESIVEISRKTETVRQTVS
jgi:hypothetical protein